MIGLASVRERWPAFVGSFVAVLLGVAVVTVSALVLLSDGAEVPKRLAGAPVLVHSPEGAPTGGVFAENPPWAPEHAEDLRRRLAALPGVADAVADRSFYARADGDTRREGERQGHPWSAASLAAYTLNAGTPPVAMDDIVVDRSLGLAPGSAVTIDTARGPRRFSVSGTMNGPGYFVSDQRAAELVGGTRVIGLLLEPGAGTARVAAAARRVVGADGTVLTGPARNALAPRQDEMARWVGGQVVTAMAALSTFITAFIVSSTFAFTVARRRREFALVRTIGGTPRQVKRMVYAEALAIGVLGATAGAVLGTVLAPAMAGPLIDAGFQPAGFGVRIRWWVPGAAVAFGVLTALAGAGAASRRASRIAPLEAMRKATVDDRPMTRGRWITGLSATALGGICSVATAFAGTDTMVLAALGTAAGLTTGLTLLAPVLIGPVVRVLTAPLTRRPGATALLVRGNTTTALRRTSAVVAPVLATVAFAVLIPGAVRTTQDAVTAGRTAAVRAEAAVVPHGAPGLSDAAAARVDGPAPLSTTVYGGAGRVALTAGGVAPGIEHVFTVAAPEAGTVIVTAAVAAAHRWPRDHTAELTFDDGRTLRLRVAAVVDDDAVPHQLLLPRDLVRTHDPSALADVAYSVTPPSSASPAVPGTKEIPVAEYAASIDAEDDRLVRHFTVLLVAVTAGYTAIAVASTLVTATTGRSRELRVLRLTGATRRQVLRALAAETCCAVALGAALGLLVAVPALFGAAHGLGRELGPPVTPRVDWWWATGAVAACLTAGLAATVLPAHATLRAARRTRRARA